MQGDFADNLRRAISPDRLRGYQLGSSGEAYADLIARYAWNIALSESLYPALQSAEIALRNSIHDAMRDRYRTELWFDGTSAPLHPHEQAAVQRAKEALMRARKPLQPGRIIAE
jgi:hypothetical protein